MSDAAAMGAAPGADGRRRCPWAGSTPEYRTYHDDEWGRPVVDDVRLYDKQGLRAGPPGPAGAGPPR